LSWWKRIFGPSRPTLSPGCKRRAVYCAGTAEDHGYPCRIRIVPGREKAHAEALAKWQGVWWVLGQDSRGKVIFVEEADGDPMNSYPLATFQALVFVP